METNLKNHWEYDLKAECDPVLRLGIHGLYRLLRRAENDDRFPDIRQTETLRWQIVGDTKIVLDFDSVADLNQLVVGSAALYKGIMVPPGYPLKGGKDFVHSVLFHQLSGTIFKPGQKGGQRSRSLGTVLKVLDDRIKTPPAVENPPAEEPTGKGKVKKEKVKKEKDGVPWTSIPQELHGSIKRDSSRKGWQIKTQLLLSTWFPGSLDDCIWETTWKEKVTPHWGKAVYQGRKVYNQLTLEEAGKDFTVTSGFYPSLSMWNEKSIAMHPREAFAIFFSMIAHVALRCFNGELIAIGLDVPTFSQADKLHAKVILTDKPLRQIDGEPRLAAFFLLNRIQAPSDRQYMISGMVGDKVTIDPYLYRSEDSGLPYTLLKEALVRAVREDWNDGKKTEVGKSLWVLHCTPLKVIRKEGKNKIVETVYGRVLENLDKGRYWYFGFEKLASLNRIWSNGEVMEGLTLPEMEALGTLTAGMEKEMDEMDTRILDEFSEAVRRVYGKMFSKYGQATAGERTKTFVLKTTGLRAATTPLQIYRVLNKVGEEAGDLFSRDVALEVNRRTESDPAQLCGLLILAANLRHEKKDKPADETASA